MGAWVGETNGLYTVREGRGPALLVMHGAVGIDHTHLRPWLAPLTRHAEVVCYDSRGNGRSKLPGSRDAITVDTLCVDAEALRISLGLDRMAILGHSGGASIALEYARRHPDRVSGLVLVSGTPRLDYIESLMEELGRRGTPEQMAAAGRLMTAPNLSDEEFREAWLGVMPLYYLTYAPAFQKAWDETLFCGAAWIHYRNNIFLTLDALDWLHGVSVPALVITGRHDVITPVEQGARRLAALLPNSTLEVFENSGHFPFMEEPERFAEVVSIWLSRISPQASEA